MNFFSEMMVDSKMHTMFNLFVYISSSCVHTVAFCDKYIFFIDRQSLSTASLSSIY